VTSWFSRAGFARERMGEENAADFAATVRGFVAPHVRDGSLDLPIVVKLAIGRPGRGTTTSSRP